MIAGITFNPILLAHLVGVDHFESHNAYLKIIITEILMCLIGIILFSYFKILNYIISKNIKYILFISICIFISMEFCLRFIFFEKYLTYNQVKALKRYEVNGTSYSHPKIYRNDNYFSYKMKEDLNVIVKDNLMGYSQTILTDKNGFRNISHIANDESIMVIGDSLTFGTGVDNNQTYPYKLGQMLGKEIDVKNYGVGGWGPPEYYLCYKKFARQVNPKLLIIGLFPSNDFNDIVHTNWSGKESGELPVSPLSRRDYFVDNEENLRSNNYIYKIPVLRNIKSFIFFNHEFVFPIINLDRYLIDSEKITCDIIESIARDFNKDIIVLIIPSRYHYENGVSVEHFIERIKKIRHPVNILNLYPCFASNYHSVYADNSHFNVIGNHIIAEKLNEYIHLNNLLE